MKKLKTDGTIKAIFKFEKRKKINNYTLKQEGLEIILWFKYSMNYLKNEKMYYGFKDYLNLSKEV